MPTIETPPGTLIFPILIEPRSISGADPRWSAGLILPSDADISDLLDACRQAASPDNPDCFRMPIHVSAEGSSYARYTPIDHFFITASAKARTRRPACFYGHQDLLSPGSLDRGDRVCFGVQPFIYQYSLGHQRPEVRGVALHLEYVRYLP